MTTATTNGNIFLIGTFVGSVGVWIEYTFGLGLITLGVGLIGASLIAAFCGDKS